MTWIRTHARPSNAKRGRLATLRLSVMALLAASLLLGLGGFQRSSFAQSIGPPGCQPRANMIELLENRFAEKRIAAGISSQGMLVEIFATVDGSTWTLMVTTPNGLSCPFGVGEGWRTFEIKPVEGPLA